MKFVDGAKQLRFDLSVVGGSFSFDVSRFDVVDLYTAPYTTWATATISLYGSPDGVSRETLLATIPAGGGSTGLLDVGIYKFLVGVLPATAGACEATAKYTDIVLSGFNAAGLA